METDVPVLIIDGNNLAHRMWNQPALKHVTRPDGKKSGMFQGFINSLHRLLIKFRPSKVIVVFDGAGSATRRAAQYAGYKKHRHAALTGAFRRQLGAVKLTLTALGIVILEREGVEADDLIWHLAKLGVDQLDKPVVIVTGDRDMLQCINDKVLVYDEQRRFMWTTGSVAARYQLAPDEIPLLKALQGDATDGVKGVPGIGKVKATELIHRYRSAERIRLHLTEDQQEAFVASLGAVQLVEDAELKALAWLHINASRPLQIEMARSTITQYHCVTIMKHFDVWCAPFAQLNSGRVQPKEFPHDQLESPGS